MESCSGAASTSAAAPHSPGPRLRPAPPCTVPIAHASPGRRSGDPASPGRRPDVPASPGRRSDVPASPSRRSDVPASPGRRPDVPASPGRRPDVPASPGRRTEFPAFPDRRSGTPGSPGEAAAIPGPSTGGGRGGGGQSPRHRIKPRFPRPDTIAPKNAPDTPDSNRVIVSDYPVYTQPQDLLRIFAKIGNVKVNLVNTKCSILTYPTAAEAAAALEFNKMKTIYGSFVTVRPYNEKVLLEEGRQAMKKDYYKKSKQKRKVPTIDPVKLELSGDFHQQLDNTLGAVRFNQEQVAALSRLYVDVERVMQTLWPGCTAFPFGSITTGLGIKSSDADCYVNVPPQFRHPNANFVTKAKRLLQQHPTTFTEILSIPRANTPIVKFYHVPTETYCDLTFKTPLGAQNSKLIAFLLHSDPRLIPMAVLLKYWAKVHDLSGTGKLTNYALTMMIIFYFQQLHVAILPSVVWLQRDSANDYIVDFWNTGFMCKKEFFPPTKNRATIAELLGGFFKYYSQFNFEELIVCPYLGFAIKKMVFRDLYALPNEFDRYRCNVLQGNALPLRLNTPVCVQDPFEQSHNVASAITARLAGDLKEYFKFAATAFEDDKNNNYAEFLKIILLQKPKLIRHKSQPEFRVNLYPRIMTAIDSPDWKTVARDMIFTIFEKMLKIKLGKVEEKVNPDNLKEKEKYSGLLTKAIWKRKQLNKLYSIMNLNFQQKQERITEEILNIDQIDLNITFQLVLTFSHEPRSLVLSLRWLSGEGEDYREFGKFFLTITQSWFMHQLRVQYGSGIDKDKVDLQESDPNESLDSDDDSPSSGEARKESEDREPSPTTPSPTTPSPTTPSPTNPSPTNNCDGSPVPPSPDTK